MKFFAKSGSGATLASAVIQGIADFHVRPVYINATSDKAASHITLSEGTTQMAVVATTATTALGTQSATLGMVSGATPFASPNIVVIERGSIGKAAGAVAVRAIVASVTNDATLVLTAAVDVYQGDNVVLMAQVAQIPVGAATKEVIAAFWVGGESNSLLIDVDGTAAVSINAVSGTITPEGIQVYAF
jgi:hypothetical protein